MHWIDIEDVFLEEFRQAEFAVANVLRATRNSRTKHPKVLVSEIFAHK